MSPLSSKSHIASRCPRHAFVINCENDILLEDTDELLDLLEPDYDEDPSVMYENDFPLMRTIFQ